MPKEHYQHLEEPDDLQELPVSGQPELSKPPLAGGDNFDEESGEQISEDHLNASDCGLELHRQGGDGGEGTRAEPASEPHRFIEDSADVLFSEDIFDDAWLDDACREVELMVEKEGKFSK